MKIVIAIPTRRRPEMLMSCLKSISTLAVPQDCNLQVVVVENDTFSVCRSLVSSMADLYPKLQNLVYRHEPRVGISVARNACVQIAIELSADVLAFLDDDETVTPNWLLAHIEAMSKANSELLGGPVRLAEPDYKMGWINRFMFNALQYHYLENERKARERANIESSKKTKIYTNNWICKMSVFKNYNLKFNEELGLAGGEDTEFYNNCIDKGVKTNWVSNAIVWDHLPKERLSVNYQFRRYRDQANVELHYKMKSKSISRLKIFGSILTKCLTAPFIAALIFFSPHKYAIKMVQILGCVKGRLDALAGKTHTHYKVTTGT